MPEQERRTWLMKLYSRPPDPHRPLDHAVVQSRWLRLHRPGPWRAATIVAAVLTLALCAVTLLAGVLTVPGAPPVRLAALGVAALLLSGTGILVARVLTSGVYVNDDAVRLLALRSTVTVRWQDVRDVRRVPARVPLLGLPFLRADGEQVLLVLADGSDLPVPITSWSADFAGRPEAYDIAALRLERWWQAGRA